MPLSDLFALIVLLALLSSTGFSYYLEKFRLVERLLAYRLPRQALRMLYLAGFITSGLVLLLYNLYLALILFYLSLLTFIVVHSNHRYRWLPNIIKTGLILVVVYFILRHAETLSLWQWIRLRPL